MKLEQIEITIGTDGKVRIETEGFQGESCLEATKELESLLGDRIVTRELTSGIFEQSDTRTADKLKIHR